MKTSFSAIPSFSLARPVTVSMGILGIIALGIIAYLNMPTELLPSGQGLSFMSVNASYPQAAPQDVMDQVIDPLEDVLRTLPGLKSLRSTARSNSGNIMLEFQRDTNMAEAYLLVRDKVERARPRLPDSVGDVSVFRFTDSSRPLLWGHVQVQGSDLPPDQIVLERLEQTLQRIPGVAKVELFGLAGEEVAVVLDAERAESLSIDPNRVAQTLSQDNFALPLGELMGGGQQLAVRGRSPIRSLDELSQTPLRSNAPNSTTPLQVGDVADVDLREKEKTNWSEINGKEAVLLAIYKENTANTIDVWKEALRVIAEELPTDPLLAPLKIEFMFEEGKLINSGITNLQQTGVWAAIIAMMVLMVFLRAVRPVIMIMAAVPLSIFITFTAMYFMGLSINLISLIGLMLAMGMLVDNSVVVAENIARLRQQGVPPVKAAIQGCGEVGLAISLGTLTTIIVFLPLPFLDQGSFLSFIFKHLSIPITLSLLASLMVATIVVPLASRRFLAHDPAPEPRWFVALRGEYLVMLNWMLRHRLLGGLLVVGLVISTFIPLTNLKMGLFSGDSRDRIEVRVNVDPVFTLPEIEDYFGRKAQELDAHREELGVKFLMSRYSMTSGTLTLFMVEKELQPLSARDFQRRLKEILGEEPGFVIQERGGGAGEGEPIVSVQLYGPDMAMLEQLGDQIADRMAGIPGLGRMTYESETGVEEAVVVINRLLADQLGVSPQTVAQRVAAALRGNSNIPELRLGNEEIEVIVTQDAQNRGFAALEALKFPGNNGNLVPFGQLAQVHIQKAPLRLTRRDGQLSLTLEAKLEEADLATAQDQVTASLEEMVFPRGYDWNRGAQAAELSSDQASMGVALALAMMGIYLIMGMLFESFLMPGIVLVTIPLAFFGSVWGIFLSETIFDTTGMIGVVILAGVVVNNGIVMVDRINRGRTNGLSLNAAILEAGMVRLRPILMTTLTTISGLVPMVLGFTEVAGYNFASLGRVVSGGLLAATLLTLFVVPLVYHGVHALQQIQRQMRGLPVELPHTAPIAAPAASSAQTA